MRALVASAIFICALGCSGLGMGEPDPGPDDPHALLAPPATFAGQVVPFQDVLRAEDFQCVHDEERWTWSSDGTFEIATPKFKQVGSWRMREGDAVHITKHAMEHGAECLQARVLDGPGGRYLLCAERPLACGGRIDGAIEIVSTGASEATLQHVASVLGRLDDDPPLLVFEGREVEGPAQIEVLYRPGEPRLRIRKLTAERIARLLSRDLDIEVPQVKASDQAPSMWVVQVGGTAEPRVP